MHVVIFDTYELQARGLQHLSSIDPNTLYVFPLVVPGTMFHSRNVPEPFGIAFLSIDFTVLEIATLVPPRHTIYAPPGTAMAVEAKAWMLERWGFRIGRQASF